MSPAIEPVIPAPIRVFENITQNLAYFLIRGKHESPRQPKYEEIWPRSDQTFPRASLFRVIVNTWVQDSRIETISRNLSLLMGPLMSSKKEYASWPVKFQAPLDGASANLVLPQYAHCLTSKTTMIPVYAI